MNWPQMYVCRDPRFWDSGALACIVLACMFRDWTLMAQPVPPPWRTSCIQTGELDRKTPFHKRRQTDRQMATILLPQLLKLEVIVDEVI